MIRHESRQLDELDLAAEREGLGIRRAGISVNLPRHKHYEKRDQVKVLREGPRVIVKIPGREPIRIS